MSIVARIVGAASGTSVRTEDTLWIRDAFTGAAGGTGQVITVERSMHLDSVFAAVRLLSDAVGSLPLKTYQRITGGGRVDAWFEPVYRLLHEEPNPEMSAIDLWSLVETHLLTWGNSYLGKDFGRAGAVTALWPMLPERMRVSREKGVKVFRYRREDGREDVYDASSVIHFRGISLDGLTGLSPIGYARATIAAGLAGEEFSASFFRNSAVPRGVLKVPGELGEQATKRLSASWNAAHQGRKNMHKVAVLEGGAEFQAISMPLEDAQFVEQSKLTVQKVARIFGVPPEKLGGDSGGSLTYSTVEGQNLHFLSDGVRPWLVRLEQGLARDRDLFPGTGRSLYPEFVVDALLRTDAKTRAEVYAIALDPVKGWMNRAEVRGLENLGAETTAAAVTGAASARDAMARVLSEITEARAKAGTNGGATHAHV